MYIFLCRHNTGYVYQSPLANYLQQLQHRITAENVTCIKSMLESGKTDCRSDVGLIIADSHNEVT
jgi:hypothetical protein